MTLPADDIFPALTMESDVLETEPEHPDITPSKNNLMLGRKMFVLMDKHRPAPTTAPIPRAEPYSPTTDMFADLFPEFFTTVGRPERSRLTTSAPDVQTYSTSRKLMSAVDDKVRIMQVESESDANPAGLSSSLAIHLGKVKILKEGKNREFIFDKGIKPHQESRNKKSVGFRVIGGKYDSAQLAEQNPDGLMNEIDKKKKKNVRSKQKKKSPTTRGMTSEQMKGTNK